MSEEIQNSAFSLLLENYNLTGEMSEESEKSALRFSVALLIGCIQYARNTVYHYTKIPKEELELFRVWYTSEEVGCLRKIINRRHHVFEKNHI